MSAEHGPVEDRWPAALRLERYILTGRSYGLVHAPQRVAQPPEIEGIVAADPQGALTMLAAARARGMAVHRDAFFRVLALIASYDPTCIIEVERARDAARGNSDREVLERKASAEARMHVALSIRSLALEALRVLAVTPEDLFAFVRACKGLRGWGVSFKAAISNWYLLKSLDELVGVIARYWLRSSEWTSRDLLKHVHPRLSTGENTKAAHAAVTWAMWRNVSSTTYLKAPELAPLRAIERARNARTEAELVNAVLVGRLTIEMLPTPLRSAPDAAVAACIRNMDAAGVLREAASVNRAVERFPEAATFLGFALDRHPVSPLAYMLAPRSPRTARIYDDAWSRHLAVEPMGYTRVVVECSAAMEGYASNALLAREVACAWALAYPHNRVESLLLTWDGLSPEIVNPHWYEGAAVVSLERAVKDVIANSVPSDKIDLARAVTESAKRGARCLIYLGSTRTWSPEQQAALEASDLRLVSIALCGAKQAAPPDDPRRLDVSGVDGETPELVRAFLDADSGGGR